MIEVEIRGRLSKEEYLDLKKFLSAQGRHVESHEREMILLDEVPGYSHNFGERKVDIRLRNTNGKCELMIKHKKSEDNSGRREISIPLPGSNLDMGKEIAKAFGCSKGVWMHRKKEIYEHNGIEWSLVEAPTEIFYYEAERLAKDENEAEGIKGALEQAAKDLKLNILSAAETDAFIDLLNREVNKAVLL